jgi:hypothetical protein
MTHVANGTISPGDSAMLFSEKDGVVEAPVSKRLIMIMTQGASA